MRATIITIVLVGALFLWLQSRGNGDESSPASDPTTTGAQADEPDNDGERELTRYLEENFGPGSPMGQTSWYESIVSVDCCSSFDGTATVTVETFSDADAQSVCTAALFSEVDGLARVQVMNPAAGTLAECP